MIIICNGAFKSGSSWLLNIVRQLVTPVPIEPKWKNPEWNSPSISPDKLKGFIKAHELEDGPYVSKNHLSAVSDRRLLLESGFKSVYVLNITRDIRDVVVSAYYHALRVDGYQGSFSEYFAKRGVNVAKRVCLYNKLWSGDHDRLHVSSYERMQLDGVREIGQLAEFLGLGLDAEKIIKVYEKTRFDAWKEQTGSSHMRKGIIGDWKNHLSASDVDKLRTNVPALAFAPEAD